MDICIANTRLSCFGKSLDQLICPASAGKVALQALRGDCWGNRSSCFFRLVGFFFLIRTTFCRTVIFSIRAPFLSLFRLSRQIYIHVLVPYMYMVMVCTPPALCLQLRFIEKSEEIEGKVDGKSSI